MIESKKSDKEISFKARFKQIVGDTTRHEEIADKVNASRQNVGNWLNGKSMPSASALVEIARAYNVSVDWLLCVSDTRTIDKDVKFVQDCTGLSEKSVISLINKGSETKNSIDDLALCLGVIEREHHEALVRTISLLIEDYANNYHDPLYGAAHSVLNAIMDFLNLGSSDLKRYKFVLSDGGEIKKIPIDSAAADFAEVDPSYISSIDAQALTDTILIEEIKKALTAIRARQTK